jgi:RNA polymerase sigma-70 factor (ECF subfamily)
VTGRVEEFGELRPLLFSIAYRILGSVSEAEDAVQGAWLRYEATSTQPASAKGVSVGRGDPDLHRRAALGPGPTRDLRRAVVPRTAAGRPLPGSGTLGGAGRLVVDGRAVAPRTPQPDRAGGLRAPGSFRVRLRRHRVGGSSVGGGLPPGRGAGASPHDAGRPRFEADRTKREELAERFFDAFRDGDVDELRELLAADVRLVSDSGGKAPQWGTGILGAANVARLLAPFIEPFFRIGGIVEAQEVNGQPGAIFRSRDAKIINTWTLDIADGQIQTIRTVLNPDELGHLGPVADAWVVIRETNQSRRPPV